MWDYDEVSLILSYPDRSLIEFFKKAGVSSLIFGSVYKIKSFAAEYEQENICAYTVFSGTTFSTKPKRFITKITRHERLGDDVRTCQVERG